MSVRAGLASVLCVALLGSSAPGASQGFADAMELERGGRVHDALDAARSLVDPLAALQAEVHVRWAGGDLVGALATGEAALAKFPSDPYLLEQCGQLAAALGASENTLACSKRLDEVLRGGAVAESERSAWEARAAALREEAAAGETRASERGVALGLARWTVLAFGSLTLLVLLVPWRSFRAARRR
jgi:hypothetical protein